MKKRHKRMVDDGLEEAATTFDLGETPSSQEVKDMMKKVDELEEEDDDSEEEEEE